MPGGLETRYRTAHGARVLTKGLLFVVPPLGGQLRSG